MIPILNGGDPNQKGPIRQFLSGVSSGVQNTVSRLGERLQGVLGGLNIPGLNGGGVDVSDFISGGVPKQGGDEGYLGGQNGYGGQGDF